MELQPQIGLYTSPYLGHDEGWFEMPPASVWLKLATMRLTALSSARRHGAKQFYKPRCNEMDCYQPSHLYSVTTGIATLFNYVYNSK